MKNISLKIHHKMEDFKKINNAILQINLKNIEKNYNYLKKNAPNTIIAACVKANSYGLGSNEICKALYKKNCRDFFVATLEEALLLRRKYKNSGIKFFTPNFIALSIINLEAKTLTSQERF